MLSRYVQSIVCRNARFVRGQSTAAAAASVRPQATPSDYQSSSSTQYRAENPLPSLPERCPVSSYTEWDTLEEVIVGRPNGARVPFLRPEIKATIKPGNWDFVTKHSGKPHHPELVKKATSQVNEFVKVLEMEGVKVRRPDMVNWMDIGSMKTPDFEEGGLHMACPRDSMLVIGNEIIESPMVWRSRYFETRPYKRLLNEYFKEGAKWTVAPKPTMTDELYRKDYPYEDDDAKLEMSRQGKYILTEAEIAFDAADIFRAGRDIFIQISQVTNYSGAEWLRRHLAPEYKVHILNCEDPCALHIDCTLMPLRPGLFLHNPTRPCQQADKLKKAGWDIIEAPQPTSVEDEKRVICYSREKPLIDMFKKLGMTPIPVDMTAAFPFGGAFHCWTVDIRRSGTLQSYFDW